MAAPGLVPDIVAEICIFGPWCLIPRIAETSFGAFSKLVGMANSRGRNLHARSRAVVGQKSKEGFKKSATGQRYRGNNVASKALNRLAFVGGNAAYGTGSSRFGLGIGKQAALNRVGATQAASQQALKDMHARGVHLDPFSAREFDTYGTNARELEKRANELMTGDASYVWEDAKDQYGNVLKNADGSVRRVKSRGADGQYLRNADSVSTGKALMSYRSFAGRNDARLAAAQVAADAGKLRDEDAFAVGQMLGTGKTDVARDAVVDSLFQANARNEMMTQFSRSTDFNWGAKSGEPMFDTHGVATTKDGAKGMIHDQRVQRFYNDFVNSGKFDQGDLSKIKNADNARDYAQGLIDYTKDQHSQMIKAENEMANQVHVLQSQTATPEQKNEARKVFGTAEIRRAKYYTAAQRGAQKVGYMTYLGGYYREGTGSAIQQQFLETTHRSSSTPQRPLTVQEARQFSEFLRNESTPREAANGHARESEEHHAHHGGQPQPPRQPGAEEGGEGH